MTDSDGRLAAIESLKKNPATGAIAANLPDFGSSTVGYES